jgi:hypothetical protein
MGNVAVLASMEIGEPMGCSMRLTSVAAVAPGGRLNFALEAVPDQS